MAHTIAPGPVDTIVIMTLTEQLNYDDMTCVEELGLDKGGKYILLDAGKAQVALPDHFIDGALKSYFTHPNCLHLAVYLRSDLLKNIANMVGKLTRMKNKLSVHDTYESAMAHLVSLAK